MINKARILILEDSAVDAELIMRELRHAKIPFDFQRVETKEGFLAAIEEFDPNIVLSNDDLLHFSSVEAFRALKEINSEIPFILFTNSLNNEAAMQCIKEGAADCILKSNLKRLPAAVASALEESRPAKSKPIARTAEGETPYKLLFDRNPYPIWVYDMETLKFLAVNEAATEHYGYSREEFLELTLKDICLPEDVPLLLKFIAESASKDEVFNAARHLKKDGAMIEVEVAAQSIAFAGKQARIGLITDVTERRRADAALRESEYKLRTLLESMSEGLVQVDHNEVIEFVNDRFCEMSGYTRPELLGKNTSMLYDEEGRKLISEANRQRLKGASSQYELLLKKKSGETIWTIVGGTPIINAEGSVTGSMGVFTDITKRKTAEDQLLHDAFHDALTGLANRTLFMDHLRMTIERGKSRRGNLYAVLFLDFDRFKVINDSLGHAEGDKLLKYIARRLEACTRTGDLVARLGGDEFVILLNDLLEPSEALFVAERIQNDLKYSFDLGGREIFISTSIGITLSTSGHARAEDMLRDADIAMYHAKAKGKAQYQVFDQAMHEQAVTELQLETELRTALGRNEFCLYYQPIINLETNDLIGFEALVRWKHPERGIVSPGEFISAAEENGLILPLSRWVLQESCRQLRHWQTTNPAAASLMVSVNLSCKQFLQFDLAEQIAKVLEATGLEPRFLKLEITESQVMENTEMAMAIMSRLHKLGVELSLDDFGTGYSSLSYLHRLTVNYLKIDRSFVTQMIESEENSEIVHTIIKLAQNLKLKVIAEGIETAEQLAQLRQLNCEFGQGFFFSQPLNPIAAAALIGTPIQIPAANPASPNLELIS